MDNLIEKLAKKYTFDNDILINDSNLAPSNIGNKKVMMDTNLTNEGNLFKTKTFINLMNKFDNRMMASVIYYHYISIF
jgi:hypothetical protein